jgi:hypothetical protein
LLGAASALGLIVIDVTYVARGTIAPIYLADAVLEAVLVALWLTAWRRIISPSPAFPPD